MYFMFDQLLCILKLSEHMQESDQFTTVETRIIMATHGTMVAFSSSQETWTVYIECLQQYFAANKIMDTNQQRAILSVVCGPATYQLICNLVSPTKPTDLKFLELIEIVQKHHNPKLSLIVQCFQFNCIVQES